MPRRKSLPLRRSEPFLFRAERIPAEAQESGISAPSPRCAAGAMNCCRLEGLREPTSC
jgi:hypothetical protein